MSTINEIPIYAIRLQWAYHGAQHIGLNGETTFDPLTYMVSIHDGATPSGNPINVDITHVINRALVAETNSYNDLDDLPTLHPALTLHEESSGELTLNEEEQIIKLDSSNFFKLNAANTVTGVQTDFNGGRLAY